MNKEIINIPYEIHSAEMMSGMINPEINPSYIVMPILDLGQDIRDEYGLQHNMVDEEKSNAHGKFKKWVKEHIVQPVETAVEDVGKAVGTAAKDVGKAAKTVGADIKKGCW